MTVRMPPLNFFDKFLYSIGKKRGVILPSEKLSLDIKHSNVILKKESFWSALFRQKNRDLPENMLDFYSFLKDIDNDAI
jgi:hypothetical protein